MPPELIAVVPETPPPRNSSVPPLDTVVVPLAVPPEATSRTVPLPTP
jgi:hypothetical protein